MKLYSKPGACSTADHIALQWTGQPFEVELLNKDTLKGPEFLKINPAGAVPALVDGDFVLLQNAAIMGYIADSFPQAGLGGDGSPRQRAEATRWLAFVNSDVHPAFSPLFAPGKFIAALGRRHQGRPVRPGQPGRLQGAHGCRCRRAGRAEGRRPGLTLARGQSRSRGERIRPQRPPRRGRTRLRSRRL